VVATRPRHPVKELEAVLREAEEKKPKWRVTKRKRYFTLWCPCAAKHKKTVHLSPSDPNYETRLRSYLKSRTCWDQEVKQ
jgi:hypothetical protein